MIALRICLCLVACLLMAPAASVTKTWGVEILTAGDLNQNFTDVVNGINAVDDDNISAAGDIDPTKLDAHQDNAAEGQVHTDPFAADTQVLATTLAQELEQIRFQLRAIVDQDNAFWYESMENVGFSTGDVKMTFKTTADVGWVLMDDTTIGSAASSADRANADTEPLFELLWNSEAVANTGTITVITANGGPIASNTAANPTVITDVGHGLTNSASVTVFAVTDSLSGVNATWTITRINDDTFSVPFDATGSAGTSGNWRQFAGIPAADAVITDAAHGLSTGDIIEVAGSDSTPVIDGTRTVTVIDANTFSIPVTVTVEGTTATWIRNFILTSAGVIMSKGTDASAQIAFDADRRLVLPKAMGRAFVGSGAGAGLTSRTLMQVGGDSNTRTLTANAPSDATSAASGTGVNLATQAHIHEVTSFDEPSIYINYMIKL